MEMKEEDNKELEVLDAVPLAPYGGIHKATLYGGGVQMTTDGGEVWYFLNGKFYYIGHLP
jgi:hypothetical protein